MTTKALKDFIALLENDNTGAIRAARALATFNRRQHRIEHPEGKTDNGGRFYPTGRDAIARGTVRSPSRAHPWSYMLRCRTLEHCVELYDADKDDVLTVRRGLVALGFARDGLRSTDAGQITTETMVGWREQALAALPPPRGAKPKATHRVRVVKDTAKAGASAE